MSRVNDGDCGSALFDFFASTNVSYYFQKKWRHSILAWWVLAVIGGLCIWSSVNVVTTCSAQLADAKDNPWHEQFNFIANDVSPHV